MKILENKPAAQALKQAGAELVIGGFNDRASLDRASTENLSRCHLNIVSRLSEK